MVVIERQYLLEYPDFPSPVDVLLAHLQKRVGPLAYWSIGEAIWLPYDSDTKQRGLLAYICLEQAKDCSYDDLAYPDAPPVKMAYGFDRKRPAIAINKTREQGIFMTNIDQSVYLALRPSLPSSFINPLLDDIDDMPPTHPQQQILTPRKDMRFCLTYSDCVDQFPALLAHLRRVVGTNNLVYYALGRADGYVRAYVSLLRLRAYCGEQFAYPGCYAPDIHPSFDEKDACDFLAEIMHAPTNLCNFGGVTAATELPSAAPATPSWKRPLSTSTDDATVVVVDSGIAPVKTKAKKARKLLPLLPAPPATTVAEPPPPVPVLPLPAIVNNEFAGRCALCTAPMDTRDAWIAHLMAKHGASVLEIYMKLRDEVRALEKDVDDIIRKNCCK